MLQLVPPACLSVFHGFCLTCIYRGRGGGWGWWGVYRNVPERMYNRSLHSISRIVSSHAPMLSLSSLFHVTCTLNGNFCIYTNFKFYLPVSLRTLTKTIFILFYNFNQCNYLALSIKYTYIHTYMYSFPGVLSSYQKSSKTEKRFPRYSNLKTTQSHIRWRND